MKVKNWSRFQHYRNRKPPWIKLHRTLLDDFDFVALPLASKALAPLLWLIASETSDGSLPDEAHILAFRLRIPESVIVEGVNALIDRGFLDGEHLPCEPCLRSASAALAPCLHDASAEREGEGEGERETENVLPSLRSGPSHTPPQPVIVPASVVEAVPQSVGVDGASLALRPQPVGVGRPLKLRAPGARRAAASWTSEACDDWNARFGEGTAPGGRIGRALRPLVEKRTWEVIRPAWQRYLSEKDAEFISPQDFAQKLTLWLDKHVGRSANVEASKSTILNWLKKGAVK